jgi:crotonobetainyl-CoA:carnitine CoA-transferase CaiB-like acyl-CoA transferase
MSGPLSGIRVIDMTSMLSGPAATMMLGDQGADIVKVEAPSGDQVRSMQRSDDGVPPTFYSINRSKRSIVLDLKQETGQEVLRRLVEDADVFIQNFRPGVIERMGFGEDAVRAIKPDIVFVSISGFGESGPYSGQRVYDPIIQALCGLADIQADQDTGRPKMVRTVIPDKTTAVTAAQAITAALFHRERTGEGQHVRLSMLDTMVAYLWPEAISGLTFADREIDPAKGQMGLDLVFETQDGFISAGAVSDKEWQGLCRALDRPELIDDPLFSTSSARVENTTARRGIMSDEIAKWPRDEILARLRAEDVPSAPILQRREILTDPQIIENGTIQTDDHPGLGKVRQPRPAARFDKSPSSIQRPAPRLGENTREILAEAGFPEDHIDNLINGGIIRAAE